MITQENSGTLTEVNILEELRAIRTEADSVIKTLDERMHKSAELTLCKRSLQLSRGVIRCSEQLFPQHADMFTMPSTLEELKSDPCLGSPYDLDIQPDKAYSNLHYLYDNIRSNVKRMSILAVGTAKSESCGLVPVKTTKSLMASLNDAMKGFRNALIWIEYEAERMKKELQSETNSNG